MHSELRTRLEQLGDDLRSGNVDRAALFWLKLFAEAATSNSGQIRSDQWIDDGLAAARAIPGLAVTALAPRRQLVERYGLFRFIRLKDSAEFSGGALADLDWQRKYNVSLVPEFADDLGQLRDWAEQQWNELGGVAPAYARLEQVLARYAADGRGALVEVLHEAQALFGGWLPREVVERVAAALKLPTADVYGVAEFYEMFYT